MIAYALSKPTLLLVIGSVGSGKGTQVELLNQTLRLPVVTMGEVFRHEMEQPTDRGRAVRAIMVRGDLVPADLWEPVLRDHLKNLDLTNGAFLDGVIRSPEQLAAFDRIASELGLPPLAAVNITLPEAEALKRLKVRGRHDDTEDATRSRLTWSREQTEPVVEQLRTRDGVVDVNGNQPIEVVHDELVTKLLEAGFIPAHHRA